MCLARAAIGPDVINFAHGPPSSSLIDSIQALRAWAFKRKERQLISRNAVPSFIRHLHRDKTDRLRRATVFTDDPRNLSRDTCVRSCPLKVAWIEVNLRSG